MRGFWLLLCGLLLSLALALPVAARSAFPDIIDLPVAFQPEGITGGNGSTFYAGSLADGRVLQGDFRTGEMAILVPGVAGNIAVGLDFDARSGYLFVGGGLNGVGRVYDTADGALLAEYPLLSGGAFGDFINDVIVTRDAAYFTNSFAPELYRVPLGPGGRLPDPGDVSALPLSGDWVQIPGFFVFNANGIEATANGRDLIIVNSQGQALYHVEPASGVATQIDIGGPILGGDGLVLEGRTLYVVQNFLNQIGVVTLATDLKSGSVGPPLTNPAFDIPTTATRFGDALYAVNAKFGTPPAGTPYEAVRVPLR